MQLSDTIDRKFVESLTIEDGWEIQTDDGWAPVTHAHKTVPYDVWTLATETGKTLRCADNHIVFTGDGSQTFVQDLTRDSKVITTDGPERIASVGPTDATEHMFDLTVDHPSHRYYTNNILSHNTETSCSFILWWTLFQPNQSVLIVANKQEQVTVIMNRIKFMYMSLPNWLKPGVMDDGYNSLSVKFENGSSISGTATTESAGRGRSISLLYLDEFAFVQPRIAREFWAAVRPVLATGGRAIITSTPNTDEDQFATIWREACDTTDEYGNEQELGKNQFKAFKATWDRHPERDEAWAAVERAAIGDERFRREYNCEFISPEETLIAGWFIQDKLNKMVREPIGKTGQVRWFNDILPNHTYVAGLDPCLGTGGDNAAITVWRLPDMVQVGEWMHNRTRVDGQVRILRDILRHIHRELSAHPDQDAEPEIFWSVENNTLGEAALQVIRDTGEDRFPGVFVSEPRRKGAGRRVRRKGFTTTNKSKLEACIKFKSLLEQGKLTVCSKNLIRELKFFVSKGVTYAAKEGEKDDLVMSVLLCLRIMHEAVRHMGNPEILQDDILDDDDERSDPLPCLF